MEKCGVSCSSSPVLNNLTAAQRFGASVTSKSFDVRLGFYQFQSSFHGTNLALLKQAFGL